MNMAAAGAFSAAAAQRGRTVVNAHAENLFGSTVCSLQQSVDPDGDRHGRGHEPVSQPQTAARLNAGAFPI